MPRFLFRISRSFGLILVIVLLTGCQDQPIPQTPPRSPTIAPAWVGTLQLYRTATPSPTIPFPTASVAIVLTPTPTATPLMHTVIQGETMLGIAIRYGIALEALKTANPEVDPRLMSVGQVLIIPEAVSTPEPVAATPTSIPLQLSIPRCYRQSDGEMHCIVTVLNQTGTAVENIQVWFGLFDRQNTLIVSQIAIPALNILRENQQTALVVGFPAPVPESFRVQAELLTAFPAAGVEERYLFPEPAELQVELSSSRQQAQIQGSLAVNEPVRWVWIVALAYDETGQIVGVRKWKGQADCQPASTPTETQSPGDGETTTSSSAVCNSIPFDFRIYSLGPRIARVEVFSEASR